ASVCDYEKGLFRDLKHDFSGRCLHQSVLSLVADYFPVVFSMPTLIHSFTRLIFVR
ncbi:unnamed protein product, partial [Amoebophrya sp. A25]